MTNTIIWLSFPLLLICVCIFAWLRGGAAERFGGLLILIDNLVADGLLALYYPQFPGTLMCGVDFVLALGLLFIALRYSSLWLGAAMILQSIALCLQALIFTGDGPSALVHVVINDILSHLMLVCIVAGTIASWRGRLRERNQAAPVLFTPPTFPA